MMSWTHQMMSQQQQLVETTPGHSQKLFTASKTVNLTEKKLKAHTKGTTGNIKWKSHILGSLLGMPVCCTSLWSSIITAPLSFKQEDE